MQSIGERNDREYDISSIIIILIAVICIAAIIGLWRWYDTSLDRLYQKKQVQNKIEFSIK